MSRRIFGPHTVETSHEDKVLFPADGITKGDLVDYHERVAESILPHLRDRPVMLQRFPDGIGGTGFYQKQASDHFPDWIRRVRVRKEGGHQDLVVVESTAALVYLADQAAITLHGWLSRADALDAPDRLVFDLDPPGKDFNPVRGAARRVHELLEELDLPSFLMTTGSRGLHVVVPLDRSTGFDEVRAFARAAARVLVDRHPGELTLEARKGKRGDRLYLDTTRNAYAQTTVVPYTVRARQGATVATPIAWEELDRGSLTATSYGMANLFRRLGQVEDPWAGFARHAVALGKRSRPDA